MGAFHGSPGFEQAFQFGQDQQIFGPSGGAFCADEAGKIKRPYLAVKGGYYDRMCLHVVGSAQPLHSRQQVDNAQAGRKREDGCVAKSRFIPDEGQIRWQIPKLGMKRGQCTGQPSLRREKR